jgi:hypothetical protein
MSPRAGKEIAKEEARRIAAEVQKSEDRRQSIERKRTSLNTHRSSRRQDKKKDYGSEGEYDGQHRRREIGNRPSDYHPSRGPESWRPANHVACISMNFTWKGPSPLLTLKLIADTTQWQVWSGFLHKPHQFMASICCVAFVLELGKWGLYIPPPPKNQ